jgi:F-type H+-transporting ATPase subunit delta
MAIEKKSIPYAKALFDLAKEKNLLTQIKSDAVALKDTCKASVEFKDLISNPTIANEKKVELIKTIFSGKIQNETLNFLNLLVKKGRLGQLSSICEACIHFINQSENLIQVKLTTATAVSDTEKTAIASKFLGANKYEIENLVNPDIIGGYVLEFDNKIVDSSISNQLNQFKNNLTK